MFVGSSTTRDRRVARRREARRAASRRRDTRGASARETNVGDGGRGRWCRFGRDARTARERRRVRPALTSAIVCASRTYVPSGELTCSNARRPPGLECALVHSTWWRRGTRATHGTSAERAPSWDRGYLVAAVHPHRGRDRRGARWHAHRSEQGGRVRSTPTNLKVARPHLRSTPRAGSIRRRSLRRISRGKVVLYDFWTYSCINCRAHVSRTSARGSIATAPTGSSSSAFTRRSSTSRRCTRTSRTRSSAIDVTWPVALDDDMKIWNKFENQYWPADYIADRNGQHPLQALRRRRLHEHRERDPQAARREARRRRGPAQSRRRRRRRRRDDATPRRTSASSTRTRAAAHRHPARLARLSGAAARRRRGAAPAVRMVRSLLDRDKREARSWASGPPATSRSPPTPAAATILLGVHAQGGEPRDGDEERQADRRRRSSSTVSRCRPMRAASSVHVDGNGRTVVTVKRARHVPAPARRRRSPNHVLSISATAPGLDRLHLHVRLARADGAVARAHPDRGAVRRGCCVVPRAVHHPARSRVPRDHRGGDGRRARPAARGARDADLHRRFHDRVRGPGRARRTCSARRSTTFQRRRARRRRRADHRDGARAARRRARSAGARAAVDPAVAEGHRRRAALRRRHRVRRGLEPVRRSVARGRAHDRGARRARSCAGRSCCARTRWGSACRSFAALGPRRHPASPNGCAGSPPTSSTHSRKRGRQHPRAPS